MIDRATIQKFDSSGMHKVYDQWPEIARDAYDSDIQPTEFEGIDHIVFSGMGGSGTVGDLFASVLSRSRIHTTVVKGYLLPRTVNDRTLVVCTSVSGDTAETMSVAESAKKTGCKMICFSSGGELEKFCSRHSVPFRKIDMLLNPRSSFPSYVYSIIKSLGPILPISSGDVEESLHNMLSLREKINSSNLDSSNPSLELAHWIRGIPMIYYPWGLQAAAIRFKNSIQENMKIHAMTEDVIEASHNGIVSWESRSQVVPIIISGRDDYIKTKDRWDVLKEFFSKKDISYKEIRSSGNGILSKIIGLIYNLDYATIYGAVLHEMDPCPVAPIDFIKERTRDLPPRASS